MLCGRLSIKVLSQQSLPTTARSSHMKKTGARTISQRFPTGIADRVGSIEVGKDADIVIYNPTKDFTITNDKMHSDCDHTIWEGIKVKGYPEATYSRGKLVFKDGEFLGERGWGKFIKRSSSGNL